MSEEVTALWERIRRDIAAKIEASGQAVQVVHLTAKDPPGSRPFMYTIGNYHRGLPELLVVDTDAEFVAGILNRLGKIQRDRGKAFDDEELVSLGGKFPIRIVDAGLIGGKRYATFVGIFYGTDSYEVRQVILPDTQGRWPDTPGCDAPYRNQPILSAIGRTRH
ncbi:MAG: DUF4262 domain-containing protein [Stellaceae bacterium]